MARWETVLGYPGYIASDEGEIKKIEADGTLSDVPKRFDEFGFQVVDLERPSGIVTEEVVARLIGELFTPTPYGENIPEGSWNPYLENAISHLDGDLSNNTISNLKWVETSNNPDIPLRREYVEQRKEREPVTNRRGKQGKAVICENIETGERIRFTTQDEAEAFLGVKNISPVLSGRQKSAAGYYIWRDE